MTSQYHRIRTGRKATRDEHRLLMEQLLGRRLDRFEVVHHINGDGMDNRITNLEVMSLSDHTRLHQIGRPGEVFGCKVWTAKLTEQNVLAIREYLEWGATERWLAGIFGVSRRAIRDIKAGNSWKHISRPTAAEAAMGCGGVVVAAESMGGGVMGSAPALSKGE